MRRVLKNSKCEVLSKHSLTGPKFEENIGAAHHAGGEGTRSTGERWSAAKAL